MAITVLQAPQNSDYISAHEDVWIVVDSTNKSQSGFKYVFQISYLGDIIAKVETTPYPVNGYGVINVNNIVRSTLKTNDLSNVNLNIAWDDLYTTLDPITFERDSNIENINSIGELYTNFVVSFIEKYNGTETFISSGTYRAYNNYYRIGLHNCNLLYENNSKTIMSNRPDNSYYYDNQPILLCAQELVPENDEGLLIRIEDSASGTPNELLLGLFPIYGGAFILPLNKFTGKTATIKAQYINNSNQKITVQTKTFTKKCSKYQPYTILFINAYGVWDSFTFVSGDIMTDIERKKFKTNKYIFNDNLLVDKTTFTVDSNDYNVYNENTKVYATEFKTKMKLTSDILSTDEYKWLFEMIASPSVYLYDSITGNAYPVQITNSNYEIKNSLKNKAETLEINIDVYTQNSQFR